MYIQCWHGDQLDIAHMQPITPLYRRSLIPEGGVTDKIINLLWSRATIWHRITVLSLISVNVCDLFAARQLAQPLPIYHPRLKSPATYLILIRIKIYQYPFWETHLKISCTILFRPQCVDSFTRCNKAWRRTGRFNCLQAGPMSIYIKIAKYYVMQITKWTLLSL